MKNHLASNNQDVPADLVEQFFRDFSNAPKKRIRRLSSHGVNYWIKYYGSMKRSMGKLGHVLMAALIRKPIFTANPIQNPREIMHAELKKLEKFSTHGFNTPRILYQYDLWAVFSDEGETLQSQLGLLPAEEAEKHDQILCEWAAIIGEVHAAGLCHGRPHIRDIIRRKNGKKKEWIFLDFEEAPEKVMDLRVAQARDALLVIHDLTTRMKNEANLVKALDAYRKKSPNETIAALRQAVRDLEDLAVSAEKISRIKPWKDVVRFAKAIRFLQNNL